jgi:dynein heavy chain 2
MNGNVCFQGSSLIQMKVPQVAEGSGNRRGQTALPVVLFVTLEYHDAVLLVQQVHKSLATLSKVIRGTMLPSSDMVHLADSIINQQVCHYFHPQYYH